MTSKLGDIVLIRFPYTDLTSSKKRPVLVVQNENSLGDFVCFQITSKKSQDLLKKIENSDLKTGMLSLVSYVKYDKCFTLNSNIIDKKLATLNKDFLATIKQLFCDKIF